MEWDDPFHRRIWSKVAIGDALALSFFVLATVILTYPKAFCLPTCVRNSGDPLLNAWILAWDVHKLTTDPREIFNANIFYPHLNTLAYSEIQLTNALLAAPVLLIFHNPVLAHNWVQLFSFAASGFGMYLLVHHFTRSRLAGIVSGIIFAFCPYKMAHSQLQLAAQWMPLALLQFDKSMHEQKWQDLLLFTLFFNLQALSSYYYALFFTVTVGLLFLLYLLLPVEGKGLRSKKFVLQLACCALLTLSLNLFLAAPYFELSRMGFVRSEETTHLFQATWTDYLTTTPENWLYGSLTAPLRGPYWSEHAAFPGILASVLALWGVLDSLFTLTSPSDGTGKVSSRAKITLIYAFLLMFSIVMAMGTSWKPPGINVRIPLPFGWLFNHIPGFRGLRVPSRFNVITMLALAVMSGYGVARLENSLGKRMPSLKTVIGVLLPIGVTFEYLVIPVHYAAIVPPQVPEVYRWLAALGEDVVVLELPFPSTTDGRPNWDIFAYTEGWRVYFSAFHWKHMVNGYSGFLPPGYQAFVEDMLDFPDESSISRLNEIGVTHVILHNDMLNPEQQARLRVGLTRFSSDLFPLREFGEVHVLGVRLQGGQSVRDLIRRTTFGGKIELIGFGVDRRVLRPGEPFTLSLLWRATNGMNQDYTIFVHLVDAKGHLLGQHDGQPQEGKMPTSVWRSGEVVRDQHHLVVSPYADPGTAYLIIGVYELSTMERLPLIYENGQILDDKIALMSLEVGQD